jgi:hypothetical protein
MQLRYPFSNWDPSEYFGMMDGLQLIFSTTGVIIFWVKN